MKPLQGIKVLDFSTLLPGPMATLILAQAGAEVIKIERPGRGDEMRTYAPKRGEDSVNFALLNRGKRSIAIDLKADDAFARLRSLIEACDIVVEQFRPGVMDRLGFGYNALKAVNPGVIYCAITGYGQHGPRADTAGHDLNYMAETGVLACTAGADGAPVLPPVLAADIAGGSYPAVINILLALRERERSGAGCKLDIAMCDNLFTFMYWGLGSGWATGQWPKPGAELLTGGSPRYQIYRTADHRYLAAAPLEDKFWATFCELIELPEALRDDAVDPAATRAAAAALIAAKTASYWRTRLAGRDVCCSIVADLQEAAADPHFQARRLFGATVQTGHGVLPALPVPVAPVFAGEASSAPFPVLGEGEALLRDPAN